MRTLGWMWSGIVLFAIGCGAGALDPLAPAGGVPDASVALPGAASATTTVGPIPLAPGMEKTVCVTKRLDNDLPLAITAITADLAPGSHHLIVYASKESLEHAQPLDCAPFSEILGGDRPLMIVERPHDELRFPTGTAMVIDPHQMIKLEAHYINSSLSPISGAGTVHFEGVTGAKVDDLIPANIAFWGTQSIHVPPHAKGDTGVHFERGYTGARFFALTTHQHRFGTRMRVWSSPTRGDTGASPLADTTNWSDPPLYRVDPPIQFNGESGLSYECEWFNPTDKSVGFGESALDEMCFAWLYYYPSHGFEFCVDGTCVIR